MNILVTVPTCENPFILYLFFVVKRLIQICSILIPIILIIILTVDLVKLMVSSGVDFKSAFANSYKKIISSILIFLVPTLVLSLLEMTSNSISLEFNQCVVNSKNVSYFRKRYEELEEEERKERKNKQAELAQKEKKISNAAKAGQQKAANSSTYDSNLAKQGSFVGQSYNLSDSQIREFAYICEREQGNVEGCKAATSLMANLFELKGSRYGSGASGLYNYVTKSGWFGKKKKLRKSNKSQYIAAVKSVLVNGNRNIPYYLDEYDCWNCNSSNRCKNNGKKGDICSLKVDGKVLTSMKDIKNKKNYKSGKTYIVNVYGSGYTFYSFPTSISDPFGYTNASYNKYQKLNNR